MTRQISALEKARLTYQPQIPSILREGIARLSIKEVELGSAPKDEEAIRSRFPKTYGKPIVDFVEGSGPGGARPLNVGLVLSGGQAPGGHNVITGIFDAVKGFHPDSRVYGFLGGPKGIFTERFEELTRERVDAYRNTGGFDMIRSGRDKIEKDEHLAACAETSRKLGLHGLVIIGGDDSNTNAAIVAEYFVAQGLETAVVGVPKTIDGDMKSDLIETSFGFDTATKVYSELIGNICRDSKSAAKYWHFVKLMGRSASHVTLECALQTHVNLALIGEEVRARGMTLKEIVQKIVDVVRRRSEAGRDYGVCLIPEGLIEFIPEMRVLIDELNVIVHENESFLASLGTFLDRQEFVNKKLSKDSSYVFSYLPAKIQLQLLADRDSHGNVQVSKIDTEELILEQVREEIGELASKNAFPGKFQAQAHFLGYEGRCAPPSNLDADYTYALGQTAAALVAFGKSGYMSSVRDLVRPRAQWCSGGVPLTSMMQIEQRKGRPTPVIAKALVDLEKGPFRAFESGRAQWEIEDDYVYPGPIQYFGPEEVCGALTRTLELEYGH